MQLHSEFPAKTHSDWQTLAEKGLRGAEFDTLVSHTEDGLIRGPLFDETARPEGHTAMSRVDVPLLDGRPWHICAPVTDADLGFANRQLLTDLKGGASAVHISMDNIGRLADLKRLLEGVYLDLVPVIFAPGCAASDYAGQIEDLADCSVTLGLNPDQPLPDCPDAWRAFTVNAAATHEVGGTDILELASFAAQTADAFKRHGSQTHDHMSAAFAVGPDAHLNIAKLRAARRLYATIADAFGIQRPDLPIHAISSLNMMQSEDAWTNMLRTMSAGFGAIAGGADYVTLRPFTDTPENRRLGNATEFAYRIARNQQLLMMEESHLGHVQDVAYGSYFHERITEDFAQAAWAKFQHIEAQGGFTAYRESGQYDDDLEACRKARKARANPVLGVTLHPAEGVKKPEVR